MSSKLMTLAFPTTVDLVDTRVRLLLEVHSADPNSKNSKGMTPLFIAADERHEGAVQQLLKQKDIDPNARYGSTMPLLLSTQDGDNRVVALLLQHDQIDPNAKNLHKMTPLMHGSMSNGAGIVGLLLGHDKVNPNL